MVWAGGRGPSRAEIESALMIAGCEGIDNDSNKQKLVQTAISTSDDILARRVIEELIGLLRVSDYLTVGDSRRVKTLRDTFAAGGHELSSSGYAVWGDELSSPQAAPEPTSPESSPSKGSKRIPARPIRPRDSLSAAKEPSEASVPNLHLLIESLRRLGSGGARSLIDRRHPSGRSALTIRDEYDMQDFVEVLLRSLYSDVRHEEWTPSLAGASARIDHFLREASTAVEVKVTRPGRGESAIRNELAVDILVYQHHPTVSTLIAVVYDIAGTFTNILGFEHDMSRDSDGFVVHAVRRTMARSPRSLVDGPPV